MTSAVENCGFLEEISGKDAFSNLRNNQSGTWPQRETANRVEPICIPAFQAPFTLEPGSSVFTIGSCFARNVEKSLIRLGFDIPTHRAVAVGQSTSVLNNYTAPSMLNEVGWALDETASFNPDKYLYEIGGKVVDLHLGGRWALPTSLETAIERRKSIGDAYASLKKCRLVILTLGLAEAWYDRELKVYLNSPPMKSLLESFPNRFVVRVLSQSEVVRTLLSLFEKVRAHSEAKSVRFVITVSPVPLQSTFRKDMDVVLANCYSKATLRSAAEEVALSAQDISYYPSFESITVTDRKIAWEDDMVHVRQEMIDINVSRMVTEFCPDLSGTSDDPDIMIQLAENRLDDNPELSLEYLERASALVPATDRATSIKTRALVKLGRRKDALEYLLKAVGIDEITPENVDTVDPDLRHLLSRLLFQEKRYAGALISAESCVQTSPKYMPARILLGDIYFASDNWDEAAKCYSVALEISNRVGLPYYKLAKLENARGNAQKAKDLAGLACTISPGNSLYKEFLDTL